MKNLANLMFFKEKKILLKPDWESKNIKTAAVAQQIKTAGKQLKNTESITTTATLMTNTWALKGKNLNNNKKKTKIFINKTFEEGVTPRDPPHTDWSYK